MTDLWQLPTKAVLGGREFPHESDFRPMLKLLALLGDERRPAISRWYTALAFFYREPVPKALEQEAMEYLAAFLSCGQQGRPGPRLLDWQHDAGAIIADINALAGREIRQEAYLHWWSFLSFFHGIREGRLSTLVGIRDKLSRGKKLEGWEQEFYLRNKDAVRLPRQESQEDAAHKQALEALLAAASGR